MSTTSKKTPARLKFHPHAYQFVFAALRFTQEALEREAANDADEDGAHISGAELLDGIRLFALKQYGLLTRTVFRYWGITSTDDFGRIVFELIDRGEMRKTERDQLSDFVDVYRFEDAFDRQYRIDTSKAFQ